MALFHPAIWRRQVRDAAVYWLLLPFTVIASGWGLDRWFFLPRPPSSPWLTASALLLLTVGLWLIAKATDDLSRYGEGSPNPVRPPKRLVTTGSYRWCRHPMFLGYDLAALAIVLFCRSWAMLLVSLPLMLLWQYRFLRQEEYILSCRFRKDYAAYAKRVPLLLPWPRAKAHDKP